MPIFRRAIGVVSAVLLLGAASVPAQSRAWKPTSISLARDYVLINDTRPDGEVVLLLWFVPELLPSDSPNAGTVKGLLDKYVILTTVHARLDRVTAQALL